MNDHDDDHEATTTTERRPPINDLTDYLLFVCIFVLFFVFIFVAFFFSLSKSSGREFASVDHCPWLNHPSQVVIFGPIANHSQQETSSETPLVPSETNDLPPPTFTFPHHQTTYSTTLPTFPNTELNYSA